jgi:hypothetical protein
MLEVWQDQVNRINGKIKIQPCIKISRYHLLSTIPNVRIVQNRRQEEEENYHHCERIATDVERRYKGRTSVVDLCPIEADG